MQCQAARWTKCAKPYAHRRKEFSVRALARAIAEAYHARHDSSRDGSQALGRDTDRGALRAGAESSAGALGQGAREKIEAAEPVSFQAQNWVYLHAPYQAGAALSVLKALANRADEEGRAFPGLALLSIDSGYSGRAVWMGLRVLTRDGVIARDRAGGGRGARTVWRLVMDVSKWTLCEATIASAARRAVERSSYEQNRTAARQKGARISVKASGDSVKSIQCNPPVSLKDTQDFSERNDTKGPAHPYMNLKVNQKRGGLQPGQESGAEKLDPKVGAMLKGLSDALARRGTAGV